MKSNEGFNPCGNCVGGDQVADMGAEEQERFGQALDELLTLEGSTDVDGNPITPTQLDIDSAVEEYGLNGSGEALKFCFIACKAGVCNQGEQPVEVKVNERL